MVLWVILLESRQPSPLPQAALSLLHTSTLAHFYLWLLISFIKTPQPLTSVSLVSCPESSCRETRTDTREKTRRTWERRARATVGDGARTRARVGARTRRERAGAKEVRNRLCFTVVEYKSKAQHHQKTATDINLCPRSRSRSGERYRYVCTVAPLRRKSTVGVYCNEKAILKSLFSPRDSV